MYEETDVQRRPVLRAVPICFFACQRVGIRDGDVNDSVHAVTPSVVNGG
jgi:hypothetical protein